MNPKSPNYLVNIPEIDIKVWTDRFEMTPKDIRDKAEDLMLWCESNGRTKKNYRAFLLTAIRRDFKERSKDKYTPI